MNRLKKTWTALLAAACLTAAATATDQAKITGTRPLMIAGQGMFSAGGTVTEPVPGVFHS